MFDGESCSVDIGQTMNLAKIKKKPFYRATPDSFIDLFLLAVIASVVVRANISFKPILFNNQNIIIKKEPAYGRKLPQTNTNV